MRGSARCAVALFALFAMNGCTVAGAIVAEKAADSMDSVEYEIAWIVHSMDGMTASVTPEEAANASAANASNFWTDGCFMWAIDGPTITYTLTECSGPFGLAMVSGTVAITYRDAGTSYGFDIVANDLTVHDTTVSFDVSADVSTDGRNVSVTSSGSALGRRGHMLSRSGSYNLQWNGASMCAGIDRGSWETVVEGDTFTTNVSNWRRCGASCPGMGGSISFSGPRSSVTLTFEGTRQATWTSDSGNSGTLPLFCTEG